MNIQSFRSTGFTVVDDLRIKNQKEKKEKEKEQQQRKIWKVIPSQMRMIVAFWVQFDPLMLFKLLIFSLDLVKLLNQGLGEKEKEIKKNNE